ncbi:MAG: cyclic nucleotide-binding domain-containing protein, partial [Amylibacter sp.]
NDYNLNIRRYADTSPPPEQFDVKAILGGGVPVSEIEDASEEMVGSDDLRQKQRIIANTELFSRLDRKNQRLLAFSAQWYKVKAGQVIFNVGQEADASYLCVKGLAGLYWPESEGEEHLVSEIAPGRLIGDLAVIHNEPRLLDLIAIENSVFLRIGASELLAVIENDAMVAVSLLRSVAGHLSNAAACLRATRTFAVERGVDFTELDEMDQG